MTPPRLVPHANLRLTRNGSVLIGGHPLRILRLSAAGATVVGRWFATGPATTAENQSLPPNLQRLVRRLVDAGMVQVDLNHQPEGQHQPPTAHQATPPTPPPGLAELAVVIPVKDDLPGVLTTLGGVPPGVVAVVVDDGSRPALDLERLQAASPGPVHLIRSPIPKGPAAARNTGVAYVSSLDPIDVGPSARANGGGTAIQFIGFIDAGVELEVGGWTKLRHTISQYHQLLAVTVVAVAPRVTVTDRDQGEPSAIVAYEQRHFPLDMGPEPSLVSPAHQVRYVPSTCLLVDRTAFNSAHGFDDSLRYGEDVDLIWRLRSAGVAVYAPHIKATHPARADLPAVAGQRFRYGTAAAALAQRHGSIVAPLVVSPSITSIVVAAMARRPLLTATLMGVTVARLRRRLAPVVDDPTVEATMIVTRAVRSGLGGLAQTLAREYGPVSLAWLGFTRMRGPISTTIAGLMTWRWGTKTVAIKKNQPSASTVGVAAMTVLDDISYGVGVWAGALTARSIRVLIPRQANDSVLADRPSPN